MITNALQRMIALEGNFDQLACEAREFLREVQKMPADDDVTALVRSSDIDAALKLYLNGVITEKQLREWSDVLEMCDYVDYESGEEEAVADVLFRLSTPEIHEPINHDLARHLRIKLKELAAGE
jgi:hypothetical protein